MHTFELITEHRKPVAALLRAPLADDVQLRHLFAILPDTARIAYTLSQRWQVKCVFADPDWAAAQLRQVPCVPPKQTVKLAFL